MYAINRFAYFETFNFVNLAETIKLLRTAPFQILDDVSQVVKTYKNWTVFYSISSNPSLLMHESCATKKKKHSYILSCNENNTNVRGVLCLSYTRSAKSTFNKCSVFVQIRTAPSDVLNKFYSKAWCISVM